MIWSIISFLSYALTGWFFSAIWFTNWGAFKSRNVNLVVFALLVILDIVSVGW